MVKSDWGWGNACGANRNLDALASRVRILENMVTELLTLLNDDGTVETTTTKKGHVKDDSQV